MTGGTPRLRASEALRIHLLAVSSPVDCRAVVHPPELPVQADGVAVLDECEPDEPCDASPAAGLRSGCLDKLRRDAGTPRARVHKQSAENQDTPVGRQARFRVQAPQRRRGVMLAGSG